MTALLAALVWCQYRSRLKERGYSFRTFRRSLERGLQRVLEAGRTGTSLHVSQSPFTDRREIRARW